MLSEFETAATFSPDALFERSYEILNRSYLPQISSAAVEVQSSEYSEYRFCRIERLAYDVEEDTRQKLLSVYQAIYSCGTSFALLLESSASGISFYLGTQSADHNQVVLASKVLEKSVQGNFPGMKMTLLREKEMTAVLDKLFDEEQVSKAISSITLVPGKRGDDANHTGFVQGLEKLIDAMRGEEYSLMILASPIRNDEVENIRSGLEGAYSQIFPLCETEFSYGANDSQSVSHSFTESFADGITENISKTISHGKTFSTSKSKTFSKNLGGGVVIPGTPVFLGAGVSQGDTNGTSEGTTDTVGDTKGTGKNRTHTESDGRSDTVSVGTSRTNQLHFQNKRVATLLEQIDHQLNRLQSCRDQGVWDFAAYVVAGSAHTTQVVASTYQALIRGEHSGDEISHVATWSDEVCTKKILRSLRQVQHPVFRVGQDFPVSVTPTTRISSEELVLAAGFPGRSVPGVPVREFASFGRDVTSADPHYAEMDRAIFLGNIYHMGDVEKKPVTLDLYTLASHTFVAGTTGSGKSNTVYTILHALGKENIPWLVIEPAKGEYKDIFGGRNDVEIYGTNPYCFPHLLQINPFSFPDEIHVLEHIDRLVEIFGACWPLYAAMPAILRESIEFAYESCGWNLKTSCNPGVFPSFQDLLAALPEVVQSSAYSSDTSSDYQGALVTRVRSLTKGLHGLVFQGEDHFNDLIKGNVIVDISRTGSQETRSLIMGIIMMKMQEYRMAHPLTGERRLCHMTVLEEAHNLFRRTNTVQMQESANIQGKSVEMLSNAVAEMRSYGEGFIFVDQSPEMMDASVIRNTNTKIIMRLPSIIDREIAAGSMGLSEAQARELSFLDCGVAAVFQGAWEQAVLCQVEQFKDFSAMESRYQKKRFEWRDPENKAVEKFLRNMLNCAYSAYVDEEREVLSRWQKTLALSTKATWVFQKAIEGEVLTDKERLVILRYVVGQDLGSSRSVDEGVQHLRRKLRSAWGIEESEDILSRARKIFNDYLHNIIEERGVSIDRGEKV